MSRVVGIDLGTTNTCAAFVSNKIPRVVPAEDGFNTMPSVVTMHPDGSVLVGQRAKDLALAHAQSTFVEIKRLLGRQYSSRTVQDLKQRFAYDIAAGDSGRAVVQVRGKQYSPVEIQSKILAQIKRYAEIHLGDEIPDAVIAVPAYYTDQQRLLVKEAGTLAGWSVRRIVNEPTAAALAYGFNRGFDQKILIYDLGGGTFDVSLLELTGNVFQVVATGGDTFLGGADFDGKVLEWMLEEIRKKYKVDLAGERDAIPQLRSAAERAKMELSLLANTQIRIPRIIERRGKSLDIELVLSREALNSMTKGLVQRTVSVIDTLLSDVNLTAQNIDEIILVGGQTRMPLIADWITEHLGKAPRKGVHPDECVALGAALLGDSLAKIDSVTLLDATSVPIGIATADGHLKVVIGKHTQLPHKSAIEIHTQVDAQESFEVDVFQGEGDSVLDAEYLGTLFYSGVPKAAAGQVSLSLDFELDEEGLLVIHAKNSANGNPQKLALTIVERPIADEAAPVQDCAPAENPQEEVSGFKGLVKSLWGRRDS